MDIYPLNFMGLNLAYQTGESAKKAAKKAKKSAEEAKKAKEVADEAKKAFKRERELREAAEEAKKATEDELIVVQEQAVIREGELRDVILQQESDIKQGSGQGVVGSDGEREDDKEDDDRAN